MLLFAQILAWFSVVMGLVGAGMAVGKGEVQWFVVKLLDCALSVVIVGVLMGWWH